MAKRLQLPIRPCKEFKVYIGNGDFLRCNKKCVAVTLKLQGHTFTMDLFILPIQGVDVVLGIQWLEMLGPVLTDYKQLTMDFTWQHQHLHWWENLVYR